MLNTFKVAKRKTADPQLLVLQVVKKHYTFTKDYRKYRLSDRSPRYNDTVSRYIAKLVKKAMSQMKAYFSDPKDPIFVIVILATFKFVCNSNKIHERAALLVLPHYVQGSLANKLISCMCAENWLVTLPASVRNKQHKPRKLLRSNPEVVNHLFK